MRVETSCGQLLGDEVTQPARFLLAQMPAQWTL